MKASKASCAVSIAPYVIRTSYATDHMLNDRLVYLPNDPQWLPSRLLRPHPHDPQLPLPHAVTLPRPRSERQGIPVFAHQHLLRRIIRHSRSCPGLTLLPRQDSPTILFSLPSCRNTTSIPQRMGRLKADIRRRRCTRTMERCGTCNGTDRFWILGAATDILLRETITPKELQHAGRRALTSDVLHRVRCRCVRRHASTRHRHEPNVQPDRKPLFWRIRLFVPNRQDRGHPGCIQRLLRAFGADITTYDLDAELG